MPRPLDRENPESTSSPLDERVLRAAEAAGARVTNADDTRRTARLLLDPELVSGRLLDQEAVTPEVLSAAAMRPSLLLRRRLTAALGLKLGWVDGTAASLGHALAVRRAALNGDSSGRPRFLVRVDEFPMAGSSSAPERYGVDAFRRFHEALSRGGNPYLLAVVPELALDYLEPSSSGARPLDAAELDVLSELPSEGVVLAQHGTTHRTRYRKPRRHSELSGLSTADLASVLDRGSRKLADVGIHPRILVPPFNRFDDAHWQILAERFDVITGGPESVALVGAQAGPSWRRGAVYVPCYAPLYGRAGSMLSAVQQIIDLQLGTWVPIVLHAGWEADDGFRGLEQLAELIEPYAASWDEFLAAVDRSSGAPAPVPAASR